MVKTTNGTVGYCWSVRQQWSDREYWCVSMNQSSSRLYTKFWLAILHEKLKKLTKLYAKPTPWHGLFRGLFYPSTTNKLRHTVFCWTEPTTANNNANSHQQASNKSKDSLVFPRQKSKILCICFASLPYLTNILNQPWRVLAFALQELAVSSHSPNRSRTTFCKSFRPHHHHGRNSWEDWGCKRPGEFGFGSPHFSSFPCRPQASEAQRKVLFATEVKHVSWVEKKEDWKCCDAALRRTPLQFFSCLHLRNETWFVSVKSRSFLSLLIYCLFCFIFLAFSSPLS